LQDDLLVNINKLSLEDLIAVKLELSANNINNRLYGFDLWRQSNNIIKEALLKFAMSTTNSKKDAARFLGLTYTEFARVLKNFKVKEYFTEDI
jgi:3-deoxy-D-manno-octulosonic-acid transferase